MTRLELAICEAENNGDIDIYTRDMMLDIINESADEESTEVANRRDIRRVVNKCSVLFRKREELIKLWKKQRDQIDKLKEEYDDEGRKKAHELEKYGKSFRSRFDRKTGDRMKTDLNNYNKRAYNKINILEKEYSAIGSQMKEVEKEYWSTLDSLPSGKYFRGEASKILASQGELIGGPHEMVAKESVLEDIYEAELNGEITPEERQSLIDYMNI